MKRILIALIMFFVNCVVTQKGQTMQTDQLFPIYEINEDNKPEKWGYMNCEGKISIDLQFTHAGKFNENLARVIIDDKHYFIDQKGKVVLKAPDKAKFSNVFSEGMTAVLPEEGFCYYINKEGKTVIKTEFRSCRSFSEGLALVCKDWKCGYINKQGNLVIPAKYREGGDFKEGLAPVRIRIPDQRQISELFIWGYIDKTGKEVLDFKFYTAHSFSEGLAWVSYKGLLGTKKQGYIDKTGKMRIKTETPYYDCHAKMRFVKHPDLIKCEYGLPFSEGLAAVYFKNKDNPKWGYIDKKGKTVIKPQFDIDVESFKGGLALIHTKLDRNPFYIDKNGKTVLLRKDIY